VLDRCAEDGAERDRLVEQLRLGLVTKETTAYFLWRYPLQELPEKGVASRREPALAEEPMPIVRHSSTSILAAPQSPVVVMPRPRERPSVGKHTQGRRQRGNRATLPVHVPRVKMPQTTGT
jgi:hypothetical protein